MSPQKYSIFKEIIVAHLNYLNMMGQMGMLWWVSSTVFVLTLIKSFYNYKEQLQKRNLEKPIGIFITAFIISIIIFGLVSCHYIVQIETETRNLIVQIVEFENYEISTMFLSTIVFLLIGTTSFLFFLIIWLIMWYHDIINDKNEKEK